jgi:hypothetical protein
MEESDASAPQVGPTHTAWVRVMTVLCRKLTKNPPDFGAVDVNEPYHMIKWDGVGGNAPDLAFIKSSVQIFTRAPANLAYFMVFLSSSKQ